MIANPSWTVSPLVVKKGEVITISCTAIPAGLDMIVSILLPSGATYQLPLIADYYGNAIGSVRLDSGIGNYTLTIITDGALNLSPIVVSVEEAIPVVDPACNIIITGPSLIGPSAPPPFIISGLRPATLVLIRLFTDGFSDENTSFGLVSGIDGTLEWHLPISFRSTPAELAVQVTDGICTSNVFTFTLVEPDDVPHVLSGAELTCDNSLTLTSVFDKQNYKIGDAGVLSVSLCSRGLAPTDIQIGIPTLPPNIEFTVSPALGAVVLPTVNGTVDNCIEFAFPFTVTNIGNMILDYTGTYKCDGETYSLNSASALATASVSQSVCASLTTAYSFQSVLPSASSPNDTGTIIRVGIRNTGTNLLTDIRNASFINPAGVIPAAINPNPNGAPLTPSIMPGLRYDWDILIDFPKNNTTNPIPYTIFIPAGTLTALCDGDVVSLNENMFVTVTVNPT
jgi:hypothetical protein